MKYITKLGDLVANQLPFTSQYSHTDEPLYSDSGRTIDGTYTATLVGWMPKLDFAFPPMDPIKTAKVRQVLRQSIINVTWYDQTSLCYRNGDFTVDAISSSILISDQVNQGIQVSLTSVRRLNHESI